MCCIHWQQQCLKFNTAFALVEYSKHIYATDDGRILRQHSTFPTNTLFFVLKQRLGASVILLKRLYKTIV